jgi:transcriptional regulator with XRE-family HTH domain
MAEHGSESRIAALLRAYGVGVDGGMSIRQAAAKTGLSRETLSRLMRPIGTGSVRRIRKDNLDKIAGGLGIPRDLLEREMMADWGYAQAISSSTVAEVLSQIQGLSAPDLAALQIEIGRMQQAQARGVTEPDIEGNPD